MTFAATGGQPGETGGQGGAGGTGDEGGDVHELTRGAYDLAGLLIGSEGTLGLITEATLRLTPPPRYTRTLMASFPEVGEAAEAVSAAIAGWLFRWE